MAVKDMDNDCDCMAMALANDRGGKQGWWWKEWHTVMEFSEGRWRGWEMVTVGVERIFGGGDGDGSWNKSLQLNKPPLMRRGGGNGTRVKEVGMETGNDGERHG